MGGAAAGCDPELTDDFTPAAMRPPGGEKVDRAQTPYGTGLAF